MTRKGIKSVSLPYKIDIVSNTTKKIAVFPGSFDPITLGHVDIINRALPLFDTIIIAIGSNATKKHMWTLQDRKTAIEQLFKNNFPMKITTISTRTQQNVSQLEKDNVGIADFVIVVPENMTRTYK